jgi:hypothetical protein
MRMSVLVAATLALSSFSLLSAQTNKSNASPVGVWKLDIPKGSSASQPALTSVTLTILKYTPESTSWRVDAVGEKGQSMSYSWSGPRDGSLQPLKDAKGQILGQESLKQDKDGALLRHGVTSNDGSSFDSRAVLSDDGGTITDVVTSKARDGKTSKETSIYRRVPGAK